MPGSCLLKCSTIDNEYTLTISGIINKETPSLEFSPTQPITSVKIDSLRLVDPSKLKPVFDALKATHCVTSFTGKLLIFRYTNGYDYTSELACKIKFIQLIADFAEKNTRLRKLSLTNCNLYSSDLDPLLTKSDCWNTLTEIDFSDNELDRLDLPAVNQLTGIMLRNNRFSKQMVADIYQAAAKNNKLRHLDLINQVTDYHQQYASLLLLAANLPLESLAVRIGKQEEAKHLAALIINTNTLHSLHLTIEVTWVDIASITNTIIHAISKNHTLATLTIAITSPSVETDIERNLAEMIEKNTHLRQVSLHYPIIKTRQNNPLAKAIANSNTLLSFHLSAYNNEAARSFMETLFQSDTLLDLTFTNLTEHSVFVLDPSVVSNKNKAALLTKCTAELAASTNPFERFTVLDKYVSLINDIQENASLDDIIGKLKKLVYPELCTYYLLTNNLGAYLDIAELPEADPSFKRIIAWLWWALAYIKNPPNDDPMLLKLSAYFSDDLLDKDTLLQKVCALLIAYSDKECLEGAFTSSLNGLKLIVADYLLPPEQFPAVLKQFKEEQLQLRQKAEKRDTEITLGVPPQLISFLNAPALLQEKNPLSIMAAIQSIRQLLMANALPPYIELKKIAAYALDKHPMRLWLFQHHTLAHRFLGVIVNAYDYPHLDQHPLLEEARSLRGAFPVNVNVPVRVPVF